MCMHYLWTSVSQYVSTRPFSSQSVIWFHIVLKTWILKWFLRAWWPVLSFALCQYRSFPGQFFSSMVNSNMNINMYRSRGGVAMGKFPLLLVKQVTKRKSWTNPSSPFGKNFWIYAHLSQFTINEIVATCT